MPEKRSRKEWKCPRCLRFYNNGWQKHYHQQHCDPVVGFVAHDSTVSRMGQESQLTTLAETVHLGQENRGSVRVSDVDEDDLGSVADHALEDARKNVAEVEQPLHITQQCARNHAISPKDLEILLFYQCTSAGNGTSREQKQTILDYVKGFDTLRTNLLPARVLTCEKRFDKVMR
jgi:hypothetical protein